MRHIKIYIFLLLITSFSCRHHGNSSFLCLSPDEIIKAGLQFGSAVADTADSLIVADGIFVDSETGMQIYAPIEGNVSLLLTQGPVKKGSLIAFIESNQIVQLQEEYLEAKNQFEFFQEEYARQGNLTVENATTIKKMQIAKRDYQATEVKFRSLALHLKLLGIKADSVNPEKLISKIPVWATANGIVSKTGLKQGSYVQKGSLLFEIIPANPVISQFTITEKYVHQIKPGQTIHCWWPYDTARTFDASIISIAKTIDPKTHTAIFYAKPDTLFDWMMTGMSLKSGISVSSNAYMLIDKKWIVTEHKTDFFIFKDNGRFIKAAIGQKAEKNGMFQIERLKGNAFDSIVISGQKKMVSSFK